MGALLRVPLFDDELFWSFLSRTARANGSVSPLAFCRDLGLDHYGMVQGHETAFAATATLVGYDAKSLWSRATSRPDRLTVALGDQLYHGGMMHRTPTRYCPECIREDDDQAGRIPIAKRYARISWTLESMPACVRHALELLPVGESGSSHRWNDLSRALEMVDPTAPSSVMNPTRFETFVTERLSGKVAHSALLDGLALPGCIELCDHVGRASIYGRSYGYKRLDRAATREALEAGFDVLSSGCDLLVALLDRLARAVPAERVTNGEGIYGPLYGFLSRRPSLYKDIGALILEHAFSRFPRLAPGGFLGDRAERVPVEFTQDTYVSALGVSRYLYQYEHSSSKTAPFDGATGRTGAVSAAHVVLRHAISFDEVAAMLGCSKYELRGLVLSGVIKPLIGFPDRTGTFKRTDRYIDRQVTLVCEKVSTRASACVAGLVGFRQAVARLGCEPSDVLRHIMLGELRKVSTQSGRPLFRALRVDEAEITDVLGLGGVMGAATARRALKVDHLSLAWLVKSSALGGTVDFRTGAITVRQKDIRAFKRDYMTMGELAARRGQRLQVVAEIARAARLVAVFPAARARDDIFYRVDVIKSGLAAGDLDCDLPGISWKPLTNAIAVRARPHGSQRQRRGLPATRVWPTNLPFASNGVR